MVTAPVFHLQTVIHSSAVHFPPSLSLLDRPTLENTGRRLPARQRGWHVRWSDQRRKGQAEETEEEESLLWSVSVDGTERRQRASLLSLCSVSMETVRVSLLHTDIWC